MGAQFCDITLPGKLTPKEVTAKFEDVQHEDRHENGHSYSGGFGQARGIMFASKEFATNRLASDWLQENCQKWEEAICVRVTKGDLWMIGAWCAS